MPQGSESHFKVVLVSAAFAGLRQIQRQQSVYQVLAEEMAGSVHALTMQTLTPQEWQEILLLKLATMYGRERFVE